MLALAKDHLATTQERELAIAARHVAAINELRLVPNKFVPCRRIELIVICRLKNNSNRCKALMAKGMSCMNVFDVTAFFKCFDVKENSFSCRVRLELSNDNVK